APTATSSTAFETPRIDQGASSCSSRDAPAEVRRKEARRALTGYVGVVSASSTPEATLARPLLRGVLHQAAFAVSLVIGTLLIVGAQGGSGHTAAAIFAGSVAVCFGASALYHRVSWTPGLRGWMRRVDHAGIYLLIAGTYTPVC